MRGLHTLGDSQLSLQSRPGNGINEARTGSKASRKSRAETSHAPVERGINASRPLRRPYRRLSGRGLPMAMKDARVTVRTLDSVSPSPTIQY